MADPIEYFIAETGWDPRVDHRAHVDEFRKRERERTGTPAPAAPAPKNLPYWNIAAVLIWICTRDLQYVERRLTGGAQDDEDPVFLLAEFKYEPEGDKKRSLVVSQKQAKEELLARLHCGELEAQGVLCNPSNGEPVSCTAQIIPACDWVYLRLRPSPSQIAGGYAAYYGRNTYPSWLHIVCPGAMVRTLWPQDGIEVPEAAQSAPETKPHVDGGQTPSPATKKRHNRKQRKRDKILDALMAAYPDGHHRGITPGEARDKVIPWLEKNRPGFVPKTGLSIDTVRRALIEFEELTKNT